MGVQQPFDALAQIQIVVADLVQIGGTFLGIQFQGSAEDFVWFGSDLVHDFTSRCRSENQCEFFGPKGPRKNHSADEDGASQIAAYSQARAYAQYRLAVRCEMFR